MRTYTYSQRSLIREKRKNTVTNNYLYDSLGRLSSVSGSGYTTPLVYTYDSGSSITKKGYNTYSYNSQNELTRTVYATGMYTNMSGATYSYDLMGNRQSESIILNATQTGGTLRTAWNYSTGSQNAYSGILASSGLTYTGVFFSGTLLYDNNGNIRGNKIGSQQQYLFYYDHENRLVQVDRYLTGTTKQPLVQYKYDAFGRRSNRTTYSGGAITEISSYGYYQDMLLEEKHLSYSGNTYTNNSVSKKYIYGPGGSDDVAVISQNYGKKVGPTTYFAKTNYYLQKDHLGSPEKVTNASGAIIEEYSYTPFGGTYIKNALTSNKYIPIKLYTDTILKTIPTASTGTLYRNTRLFTGREYDTETGLYYLRARHYDPAMGRFLQKDPIGTKDDVNLYRYVKNSPLNYTDPSGLWAKSLLMGIGNALTLIFGVDTTNAPSIEDANSPTASAYAKSLQDKIDNPSGLALGIAVILPGPGGKGKLIKGTNGAVMEISEHALGRLAKRGISESEVATTLLTPGFKYLHEGIEKVGYFSQETGVFIATVGNKILTVFKPKPNYINNLIKIGE